MRDNQHTLKKKHTFSGKGLHSGRSVRMSVEPAPENFGIKFRRTDLGENAIIDACVDYVTTTSRGTTLENGEVKISTLEHLMASLYGLRIDNALISIDSQEVPILDGSALPYVTEFIKGGIEEQQAERRYFTPKSKILYRDPKSGSELVVMPDDEFNIDLMIDFNSKVLGNQYARLTPATDFASEIAPCRTLEPGEGSGGLSEPPAVALRQRMRPSQAARHNGRLLPYRHALESKGDRLQDRTRHKYGCG